MPSRIGLFDGNAKMGLPSSSKGLLLFSGDQNPCPFSFYTLLRLLFSFYENLPDDTFDQIGVHLDFERLVTTERVGDTA